MAARDGATPNAHSLPSIESNRDHNVFATSDSTPSRPSRRAHACEASSGAGLAHRPERSGTRAGHPSRSTSNSPDRPERVTVINGPPERTLTRSPARSSAAARLCVAGFGVSASARAAIDSDMLSAIPSVAAIAIELRFVSIDILNSFLESVWIGAACKRRLAPGPEMLANGRSRSSHQPVVKAVAAIADRFFRETSSGKFETRHPKHRSLFQPQYRATRLRKKYPLTHPLRPYFDGIPTPADVHRSRSRRRDCPCDQVVRRKAGHLTTNEKATRRFQ